MTPPSDAWLGRDPLPEDPVPIVAGWLEEARARRGDVPPHAVALATVEPDGRPSARMVLCTTIEPDTARFTFYTNRESAKGRALARDPRAAMLFFWAGRQARVEGRVSLLPDDESDRYFAGRPLESRLGAWASRQSEPIASRAALVGELEAVAARFGAREESDTVPRPPHWGGYALEAESVELWVDRPGRLHDRALWERENPGGWRVTRLQP